MTLSAEQIEARFGVGVPEGYRPRYNVAPTQEICALISEGQGRRLTEFRWGLIPHWTKDHKIAQNRMPVLVNSPSTDGPECIQPV